MNPHVMALIESERQLQKKVGSATVRRVKIDKLGHAWRVRFLPVELGASKAFFVRQAQHWLHKQPIVCPKHVSQDYGGNPSAHCPVCDVAESLEAEHDDEVSKFGWRLKVNLSYITYCLVYEIDTGRGDPETLPMSEVLQPWEFMHYKSSFDELCDYYKRGLSRSDHSVLDLYKGNDFWANKTNKGVRLDKQDPCAVFEEDDKLESRIDKVFEQLKEPHIKIPSEKELLTFARKSEAAAYGDDAPARGGSSRGRGRGESEEEDVPSGRGADREESSGGRNVRSARSVRAVRTEEPSEPEPEAAEEDQVPDAEVPARSARSAAPARGHVSRPAPPAAARSTAAPARPAAATTRPAAARALQQPGRGGGRVQETVTEEEDPGVAEEQRDPAGPAEEPLPDDQAANAEDTPPAPHPASMRRPAGGSSLKSKIAAAASRGT